MDWLIRSMTGPVSVAVVALLGCSLTLAQPAGAVLLQLGGIFADGTQLSGQLEMDLEAKTVLEWTIATEASPNGNLPEFLFTPENSDAGYMNDTTGQAGYLEFVTLRDLYLLGSVRFLGLYLPRIERVVDGPLEILPTPPQEDPQSLELWWVPCAFCPSLPPGGSRALLSASVRLVPEPSFVMLLGSCVLFVGVSKLPRSWRPLR